MPVQISRRLLSVEDYHRMVEAGILTADDKVELIKGEIIEMSPIGSKHAACVNRLTRILVKATQDDKVVSVQNPISLPPNSEPEPDLVLLKSRSDNYDDSHPNPEDVLLLIEVSASTLEIDQQIKLPLYAEAGIPVVWIVNLNNDEIIQYQNPYQEQYLEAKIYPLGSQIPLPTVNQKISVDEVFGKK
ncbi:MAG: Uma2 family endonuclease [Bacteroidia bacterium]